MVVVPVAPSVHLRLIIRRKTNCKRRKKRKRGNEETERKSDRERERERERIKARSLHISNMFQTKETFRPL
jgi:hypothetical protein